MLSLDELYYDKMQKVVLRALQEEQFKFATFSKNKMCCFTLVRSTFTRVKCARPRFSNFTLRGDGLKDEKSRFYMGQNHFEASQCPEVVGSAQDGERAAGAEAISGHYPGSRPMRGRV